MSKKVEPRQTQYNSNRVYEFFAESNNTLTSTADFFDFDCTFCTSLWLWGYPTLLALGLFGNVLCLVVFATHKLRHETRILCILLVLFDSLALISTFALRWPDAGFGVSLISLNIIICRVFTVANYWLPELAAWTLVLISLERYLSGKIIVASQYYSFICVRVFVQYSNKFFLPKPHYKYMPVVQSLPFNGPPFNC